MAEFIAGGDDSDFNTGYDVYNRGDYVQVQIYHKNGDGEIYSEDIFWLPKVLILDTAKIIRKIEACERRGRVWKRGKCVNKDEVGDA